MTVISSSSSLARTRASLHALAEHVLAAARYAAVGRIGLRVVPGGFGTPPFGDDERTVSVEHGDVVVRHAGGANRAPISTLRAAGEVAGMTPGAPAHVYHPATPCDLDAPLAVDADEADRLAAWYALADEALSRLRAEIAADEPSDITLWPEHFDVAIRAGTVNYGGSPGDEHVPEPYLYVGPDTVPAGDAFWNQPFGAARAAAEVPDVDAALAFFREARERLGSSRPA